MSSNRPKVGIGVLVFDQDNRLLLGKRVSSHGSGSWGPAGGHLEYGESFEECAIREVLEETGIAIDNPKFVCVTNDVFDEAKHYISIFMSVNVANCGESSIKLAGDVEEWGWFSMDNLPNPLFLPLENMLEKKLYGGKV